MFSFNRGGMIRWQTGTFFFNLLKEKFEVLGIHRKNGLSDEFQNIDIFDKLVCLVVADFEWPIGVQIHPLIIFHLFIWDYLLTVPTNSRNHLLDLGRCFIEIFNLWFYFVFQFLPVRLIIIADWYTKINENTKESFFFRISPSLFILLTWSLLIKINLALVLLNFHDSINKFFQPSCQIVSHREVLIAMGLF